MANMFRLLRADEIDARVGIAKPGGKGVSLLLYKDARCDQNILDETVGPYNWMRTHSRENANCTVSLWDREKQQWVSKEDTGTESKTEAEKGLASDSFKRACFNWGIGRELYSAPFIWIPGNPEKLKYEKFTVLEIGYDDNREINKLAIADESGTVVYKYGNTTAKAASIKPEPLPEDAAKPGEKTEAKKEWNSREAIQSWSNRMGINGEQFHALRKALIADDVVPNIKYDDLTQDDFDNLCKAIQSNYADQLRKTA